MNKVKDLVSRVVIADDFLETGNMTVPKNAMGIFLIPADEGNGFATAGVQRWMEDFADEHKGFYMALLSGILYTITNKAQELAVLGAKEENLSNVYRPEDLPDDQDDDEATPTNISEFGRPTVVQTPPKDAKLEDVKPVGSA